MYIEMKSSAIKDFFLFGKLGALLSVWMERTFNKGSDASYCRFTIIARIQFIEFSKFYWNYFEMSEIFEKGLNIFFVLKTVKLF